MQKMVIYLLGFLLLAGLAAGAGRTVWAGDSQPNKPAGHKTDQQTLKDVQNQVAELRKSKGQMRTTTNDDRWAAARRHADRHAKAVAKAEGGKK